MENRIIVAVSGGPDSMYLLNHLHKKNNNILVCHVNYHKREESIIEEKMIRKYCQKKMIDLIVLNARTKYPLYKEKNFQKLARMIRYDFFIETARGKNIKEIYVAHNKDDFFETAMLQTERSGDYLFYGIKERNKMKGVEIVRPLLNIWKKDILKYCDEQEIPYSIDKSNFDNFYRRNEIRSDFIDRDEEKEIFINQIKEENKKKSENSDKSYGLLSDWKKEKLNLDFFAKIKDDLKVNVIYLLLVDNDIKTNRNKIDNVLTFISAFNNEKKIFELNDEKFISKKNGSLIINRK